MIGGRTYLPSASSHLPSTIRLRYWRIKERRDERVTDGGLPCWKRLITLEIGSQ